MVAVLGTGYWGRNLVRDFHSLGVLKTVVDPNPKAIESILADYQGISVASSLKAVLADPEIKAVAISTPAPTHAQLAIQALRAGRDVFVEKPLALTVEDGKAMVSEAKLGQRILMVDHLLNRHPAFVELKKQVKNGQLGRILRVWSRRHNFGKIRKDENVSWSFAPHDVAMILGLIGQSPLSVEATGASYLTDGVEDIVEGSLVFPDGITAHLSVSWLSPYKEQRLAVIGSEKMAVFDDTEPWEGKLVIYNHKINWENEFPNAIKDEAGQKIPVEPRESLREQCQLFLDSVRTRQEPPDSDGNEALEVMKVLLALDQSLKKDPAKAPVTAPVKGSTKSQGALSSKTHDSLSQITQAGISAQAAPVPVEDGSGYFAHPTAEVDPKAKIGSGVKIWNYSRVLGDSLIGPGTSVGQNVVIGPGAQVGAGCKIQNNVSVYQGVTLEDHVFCGPSMVFTNVINPRAFIPRMTELKTTLVGYGATIGANATIVCGHDLGRFCLIGAGSVVASDVPDYALMVGVPAKRVGWVCECGVRLPKDLLCPACGKTYRENTARLTPVSPDDLVD
jgi:UDP-2-acetamido-3-amino-2,3-dideoxy-glucuronate N-acetyltransferase